MHDAEADNLVADFLHKIYAAGLFQEAESSEYKNLVSREDGISVISLWLCEVNIVTISKGVESEYRQVSFASHVEEPYTSLYLRSFECSYGEAIELIDDASKRFTRGSTTMQHKTIEYVGVMNN